ncbi:MAG: ABC transporter permease [Candidatus Korarchaeota archaeon]|nr:ABC transporter permease [Thermoproteota archaeon]
MSEVRREMKAKRVRGGILLLKIGREYLILLGAFIAIMLIAGYFIPDFWSINYQKELFRRSAILGILAIGQAIVMIAKGVDLSVGASTMTLAIMAAIFFRETPILMQYPWLVTVLIILLLGISIGVINGLLIAFLKIPPVVVTLGMMTALSGITLVYTKGFPRGGSHKVLMEFMSTSEVIGIPAVVLMWVVVTLAIWFILRLTKYGREIYAIGSNPVAAHISGIHVEKILTSVYAIAGLFAAVSSLLYLGRVVVPALSVAPAGIGMDFLLSSLAIPVLGGVTFRGGEGSIVGVFIASLLYGTIRGILIALGFGTAGILIFTGLVIALVSIVKQITARQQ